jgi:hypothetical protein
MQAALMPSRVTAPDPEWRQFLDNLRRELWGEVQPAPKPRPANTATSEGEA